MASIFASASRVACASISSCWRFASSSFSWACFSCALSLSFSADKSPLAWLPSCHTASSFLRSSAASTSNSSARFLCSALACFSASSAFTARSCSCCTRRAASGVSIVSGAAACSVMFRTTCTFFLMTAGLNGFATKSVEPLWNPSSAALSSGAFAETMMMGSFTCADSYSWRMAWQTSKPLMPGIWMSKSTRSGGGLPSCFRVFIYFNASCPLMAMATSQKPSRALSITSWLTSSSSTDSTKGLLLTLSGSSALPLAVASDRATKTEGASVGASTWVSASSTHTVELPKFPSQGNAQVNVEPSPACDFTVNSAPWSSATSWHTARPKPTPWNVLVSPAHSCSKARKMRRCASAEMPLPVSLTMISRRFLSGRYFAEIVILPCSVNLQAFVTRLHSI
mmetsp:Transcript_26458/g.76367  ORF Transcript_26458/g.76367 Transcript_26458/m.76367 type:complete len:397 (+) Transcript_26458:682-1872(+)